jgi:release factor glutamine methyltransferase
MADAPLTIGDVVRRSAHYFAGVGAPSPRLDADLVIAHALGLTRLELYTEFDRPLTAPELAAARTLVARRGRREPMAYILGHRAFRRLELELSPAVLVPRPETEVLVEWVLELAAPGAAVLDWGTGSGAIALALADEGPALVVTAIDASDEALAVAQANGARLGLAVEWCRSDGFAVLDGRAFDVVAANPPYLSEAELEGAPPELAFEPRAALVAGPRGDEAIARIAAEAGAHLRPGGAVVCEIGAAQADTARAQFAAAGFTDIHVREDLAGLPRAVMARRPEPGRTASGRRGVYPRGVSASDRQGGSR